MKKLHGCIAAIALSAAILAGGPVEAKPGMCPVPAKKPACGARSVPYCAMPVSCKTQTGKFKSCLKWICINRPRRWN
jgi:hypothetical protein